MLRQIHLTNADAGEGVHMAVPNRLLKQQAFADLRQGASQSIAMFYKEFLAAVRVVEQTGGEALDAASVPVPPEVGRC